MTRRTFLAAGLTLPLIPTLARASGLGGRARAMVPRDDAAAESLGFMLGTQAYSFREETTAEAIAGASRLGIKYIELYPGQPLSPKHGDLRIGSGMNAEQRRELKGMLAAGGVKPVSFGVVNPGPDEGEMERLFEFVMDMGMQTISCEPLAEAWQMLAWRAERLGIALANHNHPKPSTYWHPDSVVRQVRGRPGRIGACADTGHWVRCGLDPVACLRQYRGRIVELHFKDIANDKDQHWGKGEGNAKGQLEELLAQGFRGHVHVEYEHGKGPELEADIAACVAFFDATCRELAERVKNVPTAARATPRMDPWWLPRHEGLVEEAAGVNGGVGDKPFRVAFVGDSITEAWRGAGKAAWDRVIAPLGAVNLGISGDRTQHLLWRLNHGLVEALAGRSGKSDAQVVAMLIGTNNSNGEDHTAEEIGAGLRANIEAIRRGLPKAKILLHAIFPRGEGPSAQREKNAKASRIAAELADGDAVQLIDLGSKFVDGQGKLDREAMPDLLHLSPTGYERWASAIGPVLARMAGG